MVLLDFVILLILSGIASTKLVVSKVATISYLKSTELIGINLMSTDKLSIGKLSTCICGSKDLFLSDLLFCSLT